MSSSASLRTRQAKVYDLVVIDDDPAQIRLIVDILDGQAFKVHGANDPQSGLDLVASVRPAIVLLDLVLPGVAGMELLERILEIDPAIDVILVTGSYSTESAVEAIQKGAYDYLTKPLPLERFHQKLDKWLADAQANERSQALESELLGAFQLEGIVGRSPAMLEVFSKIRRVAPHFHTALVTGESGTGKESAAKALHQLSPNPSGPFVVCNCAAIPENLFESELFGHVRGAFTGALQDKRGYVEAASGGTLFLDEITEVPLTVQAKLLRLLQNREIQRVGGSRTAQIDLRIVAATNRDLRGLVTDGKLREDLYYRLSMIEVRLPRLADRREDLPLLERHFLDRFAARYKKPTLTLSRRAQAMISGYSWPGNIRELENVIGYACMMTESDTIDLRDLPDYLHANVSPGPSEEEVLVSMRNMELRHLHRVLEHMGGNRGKAAEVLEISRTTLYRLLEEEKRNAQSSQPSVQV